MQRETRHLITAAFPVAFTVILALTYHSAWRNAGAWDEAQLRSLARLSFFNLLLMHAGAFLCLVSAASSRNGAVGGLLAIFLGYGMFVVGFSVSYRDWMPFLIYGGMIAAELPGLIVRQAEWERSRKQAWSAGGYALLATVPGLFLSLLIGGAAHGSFPQGGVNEVFYVPPPDSTGGPGIAGLRWALAWGFWHWAIQVPIQLGVVAAGWYHLRSRRLLGDGEAFKVQACRAEHAIMALLMGCAGLVGLVTAFVPAGVGGGFRVGWLIFGLLFTTFGVLTAIPVIKDTVKPHTTVAEEAKGEGSGDGQGGEDAGGDGDGG